jgi:large subunit ribosomal protein L3
MMLGLFARKVGMTQVFDENGNLVPITVIRFDPNIVVAHKTVEKDGYRAVIIGLGDKKKKLVTKPYGGQFPEAVPPKKILREIRDFEKETAVGDSLGVETLEGCRYVDVSGVSKGKGFQGVVRRYGFGGGRHTHGSKFHREPGSTGNSTYPHHTFKNTKLPGRMGRERVTVLSLKVERIDAEKQLLLVRGAVPGINEGLLMVRSAVKR